MIALDVEAIVEVGTKVKLTLPAPSTYVYVAVAPAPDTLCCVKVCNTLLVSMYCTDPIEGAEPAVP